MMTEIPDSGNSQQAMPAPVTRGPRWGLIILFVLIVGAGVFAGWWFVLRSPSPEQVVQRYLDSVRTGDYDVMVSCFSHEAASVLSGDDFLKPVVMQSMQEHADDYRKVRVCPAAYTNHGKTALVKTRMTTGEAPPDASSFVLVREGRQWKIDLYKTVELDVKADPGGCSPSG